MTINIFSIFRYRSKRDIAAGHRWFTGQVKGKSPIIINANQQHYKYADQFLDGRVLVSPQWNNEVFDRDAVSKVFFLLLLLVVIGEFFRYILIFLTIFGSSYFYKCYYAE